MKPWDVTDDDVANGLVPDAPTDGQDDPDGGFDAALVDDEPEEMDDPWSAGLEASAASVAPARPLSPAGGRTVPAARVVQTPSPQPDPVEEPAAAEELAGEAESVLSEPGGAGAVAGSASEVDANAVDGPQSSSLPPGEEGPSAEVGLSDGGSSAGVEAGRSVAAVAPGQEAAVVAQSTPAAPDDFDDDFWDEPVHPGIADGQASGYDLGPAPSPAASVPVVQVPSPPPAQETPVEEENPDDSVTVVLRRNRELQAPERSRTYRTSDQARRPARPSERRHKMDTAPVKQGPMARMKKLLGGGQDDSAEHETSARRATIRPLNVVVVGKKGGVGKTAVTAMLGMAFASVRNDRVLAVDASPTGGNLSARCPREGKGTVVSLLDQLEHVTAYANVREHTSKGDTGLEVLGADVHRPQRPISGNDYRALMDELRRHYQLILSDTPGDITTASAEGPGGMVDALLDEADLLVLVAEGVDGANAAVWLVNWLKVRLRETDDQHLERLLDDLIVVVTSRSASSNAKPEKIAKYFSEEVARRVVTVPFDRAVEGGLEIDYEAISPRTRKSILALADAVTGSDAFTGR